jgi:hypothetical protein
MINALPAALLRRSFSGALGKLALNVPDALKEIR